MPDWITHILIPWALFTLLGFKFKQLSQQNIAIILMGALIPDIYKISMITPLFGIPSEFFFILHMPIGSLLIAGIVSLFFKDRLNILFLLILGFSTHYILDFLMFDGGLYLLYPFSLVKLQAGIISVVDYNITLIAIIIAVIVYFIYKTFYTIKNSS